MNIRTVLIAAAVLTAVAGCSTDPAGSGAPAGSDPTAASTMPSLSVTTPPASMTPTPTASTPRPTPKPKATSGVGPLTKAQGIARINALIAGQPAGGVSVAAFNTVTGAQFSAGATSGMWTASAYKLFVLETLLLRAQQAGTQLSGSQASLAVPMIENSDNVAAYSEFLAAGGSAGLAAAAATFGMTHTVPGRSDPTFTTTSASDYLHLVKNLVTTKGPLNSYSRSFTLNLMRNVESDQRWGVGVVADPGTVFANKNGWLSVDNTNGPGETDNGLWAVTSVGIVSVHGQQVLMAVFTRHQPDFQTGVNLVQSLARAMEPAVVS